MARIRAAKQIGRDAGRRHSQWLDIVDADVLRRQIASLLDAEGGGGGQDWEVLAYDGLPDFGPHPDPDELLAYLDAVDEYGASFEVWWAACAPTTRCSTATPEGRCAWVMARAAGAWATKGVRACRVPARTRAGSPVASARPTPVSMW